jgi:hypothetical protein
MALVGLVVGPLDVAMFTLRQRRTDPAWMGRAFAVSMSFNFAGFPIGAAIAGSLAGLSIELAVVVGLVALVAGGILAAVMIPADAPDVSMEGTGSAQATGVAAVPAADPDGRA